MKTKNIASKKWMAGMAAASATAGTSQAAIVQIDLVNNIAASTSAEAYLTKERVFLFVTHY